MTSPVRCQQPAPGRPKQLRCLREGLRVFLVTLNEPPPIPRSVGPVVKLGWKGLWETREIMTPLSLDPKLGAGALDRIEAQPRATPRCPPGFALGAEGRATALGAHLQFLTLLADWAASAGWLAGKAGNFWDKRSLCFFSALSRILLPTPAPCGWRTWWNF